MTIPMPGDQIEVCSVGGWRGYEATVIASVTYREADDEFIYDRYTLLLLVKESPFYRVVIVEHAGERFTIEAESKHSNIVHAVNGNDYPRHDPARPGRMKGPRSLGYIDMGGDA